MNIPASYVLALSGVLFSLGVLGVLIRRNAIVIFMSIELMLNAANLAFIAFARAWGPATEGLRGHVCPGVGTSNRGFTRPRLCVFCYCGGRCRSGGRTDVDRVDL
jgi:hypothetical protein